jgi:transposase-like protein
MSERHRSTGLLAELAKHVIDAALEAELMEHLAGAHNQRLHRGRRNSRNGTRAKTVRTVVGPVTVEVPRDRWGTFQPMTVGKWQREVVGIDRVLLPLAAKGAPARETLDLLAQAYPTTAAPRTLSRILDTVRARLRHWHDRTVSEQFPVLHVHVSTMRTHKGQAAGFPVLSVVGATAPDDQGHQHRELLSLHAVRSDRGSEPWTTVVSDLHRRELSGVRSVVGSAAAPFRQAAAGVWPAAELLTALTA